MRTRRRLSPRTPLAPRPVDAESMQGDLMDYFVAVGAPQGRAFTIRDFNSQVMMNLYAPEHRTALRDAIGQLVDSGILVPTAATEYCLTDEGARRVNLLRESRGGIGLSAAVPLHRSPRVR